MNEALNENYKTILQLDAELNRLGIEHELKRMLDGWILFYPNKMNRIGDVIEHFGSYGHECDLVEAYGFPECKGDVIANLTFEEALKLFKDADSRRKANEKIQAGIH